MSSVLKLGVVTYVCLGPISVVALTGLHAVIVAWGAYFSPLLSLARILHLRLHFLESLPRGVSEVSGRCPCYLPLPYCEIPPNTKCTCVLSSHQQPFSNFKPFGLLCHQDCLVVGHWHTQPAYRRSGEIIIVSISVLVGPFEYSSSVQVYMVFVREPKCEYRECA